jgi:hypothetical protein
MNRFGSLLCLAVVGAACSRNTTPTQVWTPGVVYETPRDATSRGFLDRRGLIHAHSVYSHDACDGEPVKDGVRDPACFEDFRRDLCAARHDFVFLTDHRNAFGSTEFPEGLLYRAEKGDALIERDGSPVASSASCPDGHRALIMAGTESGLMPVGLERHIGTPETRGALYNETTANAAELERANGAVVLVAHTEGWSVDELSSLPLDGFEMFNLHANFLYTAKGVEAALSLMPRVKNSDPTLGNPNLIFLQIFNEDPQYLSRWGSVLAKGVKRVTTMGTDCHRNSLPEIMSDGERIDSYRRMMIWFSNHLLVKPKADGTFDDRDLKEALRNGRLYGAFDSLGYPVGFDYRAESRGSVSEMGSEVALADSPELRVTKPVLQNLDPKRTPPEITVRILRAVEGGFEEVATGANDLAFKPTQPGAYRAEVRMIPYHLREDLKADATGILASDYPWIYSNPIYVR